MSILFHLWNEITLGLVGQFWRPVQNFLPFFLTSFHKPVLAGMAIAVWNFPVQDMADGRAQFVTVLSLSVQVLYERTRVVKKAAWFRKTLLATAVMNVAGFVSFLPQFPAGRVMSGLPEAGHPLYAWIVAVWILLFGIAYGRLAFLETPERLFVQVGAIGKLSFFVLVVAFTFSGDLPPWAPVAGVADLIFAGLFFVWLSQTRAI